MIDWTSFPDIVTRPCVMLLVEILSLEKFVSSVLSVEHAAVTGRDKPDRPGGCMSSTRTWNAGSSVGSYSCSPILSATDATDDETSSSSELEA